jgi:hypothetical protein
MNKLFNGKKMTEIIVIGLEFPFYLTKLMKGLVLDECNDKLDRNKIYELIPN